MGMANRLQIEAAKNNDLRLQIEVQAMKAQLILSQLDALRNKSIKHVVLSFCEET